MKVLSLCIFPFKKHVTEPLYLCLIQAQPPAHFLHNLHMGQIHACTFAGRTFMKQGICFVCKTDPFTHMIHLLRSFRSDTQELTVISQRSADIPDQFRLPVICI